MDKSLWVNIKKEWTKDMECLKVDIPFFIGSLHLLPGMSFKMSIASLALMFR